MDGIFGGKNMIVNIRDFQWKIFILMQLNMDGWGFNEKYFYVLGEFVIFINCWYLKLKLELLFYIYSFVKEVVIGMLFICVMFLEYLNVYILGIVMQYQFMYGIDFLVVFIYKVIKVDVEGNDICDGIYLFEGEWIDYFIGEKYQGNCVFNNFVVFFWKFLVFVKNGVIILMINFNNNVVEINKGFCIYEIYLYKYMMIVEYDDDGIFEVYKEGKGIIIFIELNVDLKNNVKIFICFIQGDFDGFVKEKVIEFRVNVIVKLKKVFVQIGKGKVKLIEVFFMDDFWKGENVYFYDVVFNLNKFVIKGSEFEKKVIIKNF